jgi:cell volume regulation protein A
VETIANINLLIVLGGALLLVGVLSSLISTRFGAPLLLVFLGIGMLAGEDGPGNILFDDFGLAYFIGSLALAVILFDGGLRTRFSAFRGVLAPSAVLATVGVVLTAVLVGVAAYGLLDFDWRASLLLGCIVASTDAAAVFFLLHTGGLRLKRRAGATLEIESGTNDPFAVFLVLALVQVFALETDAIGVSVFLTLAQQLMLGAAFGIAGGYSAAWLLRHIELPNGLHPLLVLSMALATYGVTAWLGGSGFLAVYLTGLILGNQKLRAGPNIIAFHEAVTWLSQIVMFVMLGLLVTPSTLMDYAVPGLMIALFLMFIARPLAVWACLTPFGFTRNEKLFISWVGLRGAVSIFLAAIPMLTGLPMAEQFFNLAFFVVLVSLLVQGWTIRWSAERLGVALADRDLPVHRTELDLPGQLQYEMVGYPVGAQSLYGQNHTLPAGIRPMMVVRAQKILEPQDAGMLETGDYAYFLATAEDIRQLDRLFATRTAEERRTAEFASFPLAGDAPMGEIALVYGLALDDGDEALSLSDWMKKRLGHTPKRGEEIAVGPAVIIARTIEHDSVSHAQLRLEMV